MQAGNPINVAQGNKYQKETDFVGVSEHPLELIRYYNSQDTLIAAARMGSHWRHTYERALDVLSSSEVVVQRPDGRRFLWTLSEAGFASENDDTGELNRTNNGWRYRTAGGVSEKYGILGQLVQIIYPNQQTLDLAYDGSRKLQSVQDSFGFALSFAYNADGRIDSVTAPGGRVFYYDYGDTYGNLTSVTYAGIPGAVRLYHYEDPGFPNALTGITDENGNRYATFEYDTQGRATASYHGPQTSILTDRIDGVSITYNPDNTRTVTDSRGNQTNYQTTTQLGVALATQIDGPGCASCGGSNTAYTYDANNNLLSKRVNGIVTRYGNYDDKGNYRCMVEGISSLDTTPLDNENCSFDPVASPDARRIDYSYDLTFTDKVKTVTRPSVFTGGQKIITYEYDGYGNRTQVKIDGFKPEGSPISRVTTYKYGGNGPDECASAPLHQLCEVDGPRTDIWDVTTYRYYADEVAEGYNRARLKEIEDAHGSLIRSNIQYTATGKIASEARPNGLTLDYTYTAGSDRLEALTESAGGESRTTCFTYLNTGEVASITSGCGTPEAATLIYGYDDARRLVRITDNIGNYIRFILDSAGNKEREEIWDNGSPGMLKKVIAQTFDLYNRLSSTTSWANPTNNYLYHYSPDGTLDWQMDGKGTETDYTYDDLKRLVTTIHDKEGMAPETADTQTDYHYDSQDNLTRVIDPLGIDTTYEYDDLGNRVRVESPDSGTTTTNYDEAGNLIQQTDARGTVVTYTYDALNRLVATQYPDTSLDIDFIYDMGFLYGEGRLSEIWAFSGDWMYDYDPRGNLVKHTWMRDGLLLETGYGYDASDRLIEITYPSGRKIGYQRDSLGQVVRVELTEYGHTRVLADNIQYLPFGPLQSLDFGNGLHLSRTYDQDYRLTQQTTDTLQDIAFLFDDTGNLIWLSDASDAANDQTFGYDALNRLVQADGSYGNHSYLYDALGNRLAEIRDWNQDNYDYAIDSHHLLSVQASGGNWTSRSYDAAGNTTWMDNREFIYNDMNRLTAANDITLDAVYEVDAQSRRITKSVNGITTFYIYDTQGRLIAETDDEGSSTKEYLYLDDQLLAMAVGPPWNRDRFVFTGENDAANPAVSGTFEVDFAAGQLRYSDANGRSVTFNQSDMTTWYDNSHENGRDFHAQRYLPGEHLFVSGTFGIYEYGGELEPYGSLYMTWVPDRYHRYAFSGSKNTTVNGGDGVTGETATFHFDSATGIMTLYEENDGTTQFTPTYLPETNYGGYVRKEYLYQNAGLTIRGWLDDYGSTYDISIEAYTGDDPWDVSLNTQHWDNQGQDTIFFYHTDHLGTPQRLTDENQNLVWSAQQLPFGQMNVTLETVTNNIRFPGQYYDQETGLHYNYYRTYDPATGRYLESDPIGLEGGLNTFVYAENNPIIYADPYGLRPIPNNSGPHPGGWGPGGPRYGNWVGAGWSGGSSGNAPPIDSLDKCGKEHDQCWAKCQAQNNVTCPVNPGQCKDDCNRKFTMCVNDLSNNPRNWPKPPPNPNFDNFSSVFRSAGEAVGRANFFGRGP
ncbi:MAG: RHS domain-containing protein [Chromatiaceae bacterium]|nr:RHS domain-containing protein [Chromatiaceae bacterium]